MVVMFGNNGKPIFVPDSSETSLESADAETYRLSYNKTASEADLNVLGVPIADACHPDKINLYGADACRDLCEPSLSCCYETDESTCDKNFMDDVCHGIGMPCKILGEASAQDGSSTVSPMEAACDPNSFDQNLCEQLCKVFECCQENGEGGCKDVANCSGIAAVCASPERFQYAETDKADSLSEIMIIGNACDPHSVSVFGPETCQDLCAIYECCFQEGPDNCEATKDCANAGAPCAIVFDQIGALSPVEADVTFGDFLDAPASLPVPGASTPLVDPPANLNELCQVVVDGTVGTLSSACQVACSPSSCCSDPDPSTNCFDEMKDECLKYKACFIDPELSNLCKASNLETDEGLSTCLSLCVPFQCCFDKTSDSCMEEGTFECQKHIACEALTTLTEYGEYPQDPTIIMPSEVDAAPVPLEDACSDGNPDGLGLCFQKCEEKLCCFDQDASNNCSKNKTEECEIYQACRAAIPQNDLLSICSAENVQTLAGRDECSFACEPARCCTALWHAEDCPPEFCGRFGACFEMWSLEPAPETSQV